MNVASPEIEPADPAPLMAAAEVATLLLCSPRHVYRLSEAGRMPPAIRLGALVRWNRSIVEQWIADDCPPCRRGARRAPSGATIAKSAAIPPFRGRQRP